jgi:hypothetical protein
MREQIAKHPAGLSGMCLHTWQRRETHPEFIRYPEGMPLANSHFTFPSQ